MSLNISFPLMLKPTFDMIARMSKPCFYLKRLLCQPTDSQADAPRSIPTGKGQQLIMATR